MAKIVKFDGLLRFKGSKSRPRTERADRRGKNKEEVASKANGELPPFQRIRVGTELFLAAGVIREELQN